MDSVITVNGEEKTVQTGTALEAFLTEQGYSTENVVVVRNEEFVPRYLHETTLLEKDDKIKILYFVDGG